MKKIKSFIFDLDGTLINTAPDLLDALNHTLIKNSLPKISPRLIGNLVGFGATQMIKKAFNHFKKDVNTKDLDILTEEFLDFYKVNCSKKSKPYPMVKNTLKSLYSGNYKLVVCTNKKQKLAEKVIEDLKLKSYFQFILGSSEKFKMKPNTEMLEFCLRKLKMNNKEAVMVGDSLNDISPAIQMKMKNIYVKYGFGSLGKIKPTYKIKEFNEILRLI